MILLAEFFVALVLGMLLAVGLERLTQRRLPNYGKLNNSRRDFDVFLKFIKKKAI